VTDLFRSLAIQILNSLRRLRLYRRHTSHSHLHQPHHGLQKALVNLVVLRDRSHSPLGPLASYPKDTPYPQSLWTIKASWSHHISCIRSLLMFAISISTRQPDMSCSRTSRLPRKQHCPKTQAMKNRRTSPMAGRAQVPLAPHAQRSHLHPHLSPLTDHHLCGERSQPLLKWPILQAKHTLMRGDSLLASQPLLLELDLQRHSHATLSHSVRCPLRSLKIICAPDQPQSKPLSKMQKKKRTQLIKSLLILLIPVPYSKRSLLPSPL
jgi:hypothetical protein